METVRSYIIKVAKLRLLGAKAKDGSQQTGKFFKSWEYQTILPAFWETPM